MSKALLSSPSLRLRANSGSLDNRPPSVDLGFLERGQPFRGLLLARSDVEPQLHKPLLYGRIGKRFDGRGVELGDDFLRGPLRRPEAEPARHIKSGHARLVRGRNVRHRCRAFRRQVGERLDLAAAEYLGRAPPPPPPPP